MKRFLLIPALLLLGIALSACALMGGGAANPEPTVDEARVIVPTFTPTPEGAEVVAPTEPPPVQSEADAPTAPPAEEPTATPEPTEEPTATPEPAARLYVNIDLVNVRQGPGTGYGLVGTADQDQELEIIGKNEAGDWWQICCVNGEPGWVFGELARVENTEGVQVAANIPALPVAPTQPPAPTAAPAEPTEPPAPQPATDADLGPCGGDDGCKFRVTGGPATGGNGGMELKLQFAFVHGGRGDEAQGSYFVVLKKDGVKLPVPDSVRSIAKTKQQGQLGEYNYEFSMGTSSLPGNSVQGSYRVWVLDGNGERDSEPFDFTIDNPQNGLLWIKFDQG
ncbi:MAG: SH3 domain-containing protein [Caldilineaceae bacterium]|nr:SH3 domain-containing protein [Caldilineaceae bacterium]